MEIDENTMRKLSYVFIFVEIGSHEKYVFFEQGECTETTSRIRVGEGSPKDKKMKQIKNTIKSMSRKIYMKMVCSKYETNHPKSHSKWSQNR